MRAWKTGITLNVLKRGHQPLRKGFLSASAAGTGGVVHTDVASTRCGRPKPQTSRHWKSDSGPGLGHRWIGLPGHWRCRLPFPVRAVSVWLGDALLMNHFSESGTCRSIRLPVKVCHQNGGGDGCAMAGKLLPGEPRYSASEWWRGIADFPRLRKLSAVRGVCQRASRAKETMAAPCPSRSRCSEYGFDRN